jgi:cytochrome b pre-mRNA-processing protein 3
MLTRLFRRSAKDESAASLYQAAVNQARRPEFYLQAAVPDTLDGRFDLLALHVFLLLHRLRAAGPNASALAQAVFDLMFADMDHNLRELGVGDLSVGRKVKTMAKALMGRIAAYEPGLADPVILTRALGRNLYRGQPVADEAVVMVARYVGAAFHDLARQDTEALLAGQVRFIEPLA